MIDVTIRLLSEEDWEIFRAVRLRALQQHPGLFFRSYADEAAHPESHWRATLDQKGKCVFGLFDRGTLIGIAGAFTWRDDPSGQTGVLAMDYIAPDYRGRGLSKWLYRARIDWALHHSRWSKLVVSHRAGNEASRRANQAFGFGLQGKKTIRWPDGSEAEEWQYSLDLEALRRGADGRGPITR